MHDTQRKAEEADFAAFCVLQHPRLVGALTLYCRNPELAQDLAQEALARIWRDWRRLQNVTSLEAYTFRAAFNLANSHFRKRAVRRRHQRRIESEHEAIHHDPDTAANVELRHELAELAPNKRLALVLRYYADLSVASTAEVMKLPQNTVKTLTRRALADLRHVLGDVEEEHDVH